MGGLLLAGCLATTVASHAQSYYVAGTAGTSNWSNLPCSGGCDSATGIVRLAGGWRLNRVFAAEAFVLDMGEASSSDFFLDGKVRGRALGAVALLGWQGEQFDIAGKLGAASVWSRFSAAPTSSFLSQKNHSTEPVFGMLVAVRATPKLSVRFDYDLTNVEGGGFFGSLNNHVHAYTLGLSYAF
jgi:hypothetical protein